MGEVVTATLAAAPTVASFAAAVRSKTRRDRPTLVPLRPEGDGRPLFLVAGAGSAALALRTLAQRIEPGTPVLGLQANGLENRALPDWSVERIARRHVATAREQQPAGPYRLAGHSLGGLVALEMAQQLRRAGEEVEVLVVLDSFPPDPSLMPAPRHPSTTAKVKEGVSLALTGIKAHSGLGPLHPVLPPGRVPPAPVHHRRLPRPHAGRRGRRRRRRRCPPAVGPAPERTGPRRRRSPASTCRSCGTRGSGPSRTSSPRRCGAPRRRSTCAREQLADR